MMNTVLKNEIKDKLSSKNFINEIYLLPKWEKISSFAVTENSFFLKKKITSAGLYRKFSSKNLLEKYSIKNETGCSIANMDLKVYKDSVYIINLKANTHNFNKLMEILLQTAVEKALYNTSEKEVFVNLEVGNFTENKIKKILLQNEFACTENQSALEKKMFGETFKIKVTKESSWFKKIKENPILINK